MRFISKYWLYICALFLLCILIKPSLGGLVLGSIALYIGFVAIVFLRKISKTGIECTGTILFYESDNEGYKIPMVGFITLTGETIQEKPHVYASSDLSKLRNYKNNIDENVVFIYDPNKPTQFVIKRERPFSYFVFIFCILAGLFFIGLCIADIAA